MQSDARSRLTRRRVPDEPVPFAYAVTQSYARFVLGQPRGTVCFHATGQAGFTAEDLVHTTWREQVPSGLPGRSGKAPQRRGHGDAHRLGSAP